ncbi:hypothetical protein MPTK1_4g06720 [Marchantia polymorpha subsp. ruderalis]|uniref:DUF7906 domain-containing protein n=2 Tax=Marchantia polymorpha TaxID=3197 RepID=A0AAF6B749_MARPO|nr:hypothetical protein MARPO_0125s0017 [Marchantia polymorpha]BBN07833.1 hypothetical protein Mp_4g06720 [Marchantia polymorpha subsp. ruderalis]|eukprot:PTQ30367.1 hypothetical protein MARPO_0125s0017 [Marchantia polymorpha]
MMEVSYLRPSGGGGRTMRRFFPLLVVVLLLISTALTSSAQTIPRDGRVHPSLVKAEKKKSVLSLFKLGMGSKFWNEKVMGRGYEDLTLSESSPAGKAAMMNYTKAGTISHYLKLSVVDAIHLPLPINFIFIGFGGEGNQGVILGEDEMERWFTNIDHILEHTRIPQLGEALTPFYRLKGTVNKEHHLPLISYAHYNYSVHGIELDAKVTAVFERAIKIFGRRDNYSDTSPDKEALWQVDMGGMTYLFSNLVEYLQLENAYNIFILNPKRDAERGTYAYRHGLSAAEMDFLKANVAKTKPLLSAKVKSQDILDVEKFKHPLYDRHPLLRFSWTSADNDHTATWADTVNTALDTMEHALQGKSGEDIALAKAEQILNGKDMQLAASLRRGLKPDGESGLRPECLVDTWVGQDRWAFVDLSAGPVTWGPAVGGDGVRTEMTLPSVDISFGHLPLSTTGEDETVQEEFQELWRDRFTYMGEDEQHAVDMLLAEIDVYEVFADRHCRGRKVALTFCEELLERISDVKDELGTISTQAELDEQTDAEKEEIMGHKIKAADALRRIDEWNIFGFVNQHTQNFSTARDSFLASLGSVLASSMRHVVTPSTADGAYHFYENVYFQIYFISEAKYKHDSLIPVDIIAVKAALSRLVVPAQTAVFGVQKLALSEDPALAMAFAAAKRAAVVPMLSVNGTYRASQRVYLDSAILQHHIKQLVSLADKKPTGRNSIEVPIFWFLRSGKEPLLIDKHYQAKALPDMVIVVQSTKNSWESHLQCNGESVYWDLTQPSKAAIAAVAEHMAGIIPSEVTYSQAHENAMHDWTWSVGAHPFSSTSAGWNVAGFHNDAMARSYIVTAFDESVRVVNSAVEILANERTQKLTFPAFRAHEQKLRYSYNAVVNLWKRIAGFTEDLHYAESLKLLNHLEMSSLSFMSAVNETINALHPVYCTRQRKLETRVDVLTGLAFLTVIVVLWLLFRPRRIKPKIN